MNKLIFYIAIGLIVGFEVFYLTSQNSAQDDKNLDPPAAQKISQKDEGKQEQIVDNFSLVDAKKQKKELELWSIRAHKGMGSTVWTLEKVKALIYSENAIYTLYGNTGTVDEIKKNMVIEGDVRMESDNGYKFFTQHLNYDPDKKKITTADKVTMEGQSDGEKDKALFLEGVGLDVDLITNQMILQAEVKGRKAMSDGRMMKISSDMAEMSGKKRSMIFKNNVVINVDEMVVKGNYADFQYKNGALDTLYMSGGIHMRDQDKIGSSGIAIVYFNEDKYVFKKKPFITQGENELIGDEITVFNGGQRVRVTNAKAEYHQQENKK